MRKPIQDWQKSLKRPNAPDEWEVKQLLSQFGIAVPANLRLERDLTIPAMPFGPPYVIKACSPMYTHKTDFQAVALNVGRQELESELGRFFDRFHEGTVLVEEQIIFEGPELILGAIRDPNFGPAVMVGAGGILTELFKDVTFRLSPCSMNDAKHMLDELKIAPVLNGFRGLSLDPDQLANIITVISELTLCLDEQLGQLDINPIVFANGRWMALDAKLVFWPDPDDRLARQ
jgi:hypothetical protein